MTGALNRRLVGPIWLRGVLVTDVWIGDAADPPLSAAADVHRALLLTLATGLAVTLLSGAGTINADLLAFIQA